MSECKVFDPMMEIRILTERIKQLEGQVAELKRSVQSVGVWTNNTTWAVGKTWPVDINGEPLKYVLEGK